ncbi:MAG: hypothetical protein CBC47_07365 [Alphaproteobacteria bacterium TMED87]|nr:hypothetical protein [Rhodospirillaceae bacterium]OUV08506.1 MAG: hypothetical protein CBC47_07365 [Alphaproteobacteria bacterium TMED87]|tara:strand:- start:128 stop:604 length:477 start_codon:yes stop_codon:yes gene_type:complete
MKIKNLVFIILFLNSCSNEEVRQENLRYKEGIAYIIGTADPFTGKAISQKNGKFIITFENGLRDGKTERYWTNGRLRLREYYKLGKLDGLHEMFYANGQIEMKINYINDKITNTAEWYHSNGKLSKKSIYEDGKAISIECFDKLGTKYEPSKRGLCLN